MADSQGCMGDHANGEKATATMIQEKKHDEPLKELGEKALPESTALPSLLRLVNEWRRKKVAEWEEVQHGTLYLHTRKRYMMLPRSMR